MRLNRTAQLGLIVIGFALLLAVYLTLSKGSDPKQAAGNSVAVTPVNAPAGPPAPTGGMLAARFDIPDRTILTRDMFELAKPLDGESSEAYVTDFRGQALNFVTARPIIKGARLEKAALLGHLSELGVSAVVREGMRAITIAVPTKTTLHDIVAIGDYVDVVGTFDQVESKILAGGVRVLAVDVYGRDFEKSSVAKRGGFKGDDRPGGPPPPPNPNGQPASPGEPGAAPTPVPGQPAPPKPEMALTLEVKPETATAITLAQAANAPLEFLLQPRPRTGVEVGQDLPARITKPQVAPYAVAFRRGGDVKANKVVGNSGPVFKDFGPVPTFPPPVVTPMAVPKKTYEVTIFPDGLPARTTTVPLPKK